MERLGRIRALIGWTWGFLALASVFLLLDFVYSSPGFPVAAAIILMLVLLSLLLIVREFRFVRRTEYTRFRDLFTLLSDGIIVMDPKRTITYINPAAARMTGFGLRDSVPYCRYCEERQILPGQKRCLLAEERHRHYFESQLPTKTGSWVDVGMSRTFLTPTPTTPERDMVITIRDVTLEKQEEELQLSRHLTHHTFEVQEEERKRLSQELHDGVSQTLYGISLGLEHLARHVENSNQLQQLRGLHEQVKNSIEEVRSLSRTLYPAVLYHLGLVAALRTMAETLTTPQRTVSFNTDFHTDSPFDADTSVHLYRVVQEAVHNAILHGHASRIEISLKRQPRQAKLTIRDNGSGFWPVSRPESQGYGLRNMEERARAIDAIFRVQSQPKEGTIVQLELPRQSELANANLLPPASEAKRAENAEPDLGTQLKRE